MKRIKWLSNSLEKFAISTFMITMVILIFVQVFTRYVLGDALTWSEEASRYLFIWLVFLSIGIAFKENKHISIDILKDVLPFFTQKLLTQFVYIILLLLSILFIFQGFILIDSMKSFGQHSATLGIPMWIIYSSLPIGFFFTVIRLIQSSYYLWKQDHPGAKGESFQ